MDKNEYILRYCLRPEQDDLDRVNCGQIGEPGHQQCGVCPKHDRPRFICGCLATKPELRTCQLN